MKKIKFIPDPDYSNYVIENIPEPVPAKTIIPEWYKKGEILINSITGEKESKKHSRSNGGLKSCVPFLDAMVSGYLVLLPCDYYVKTSNKLEEHYPVIKNKYSEKFEKTTTELTLINERLGDIGSTMARPNGYCENHMAFNNRWGVRLPSGWSLLITHPLNRFELPFMTTSGIIDSDEWWTGGNIPFYFKKDFDGVIPAGTPVAQLVPIKRSSWISHIDNFSKNRTKYIADKARSVPVGWYRDNIWVKKEYE